MRLISQHGNVDIPYEKTTLLHAQDYVIARIDNKVYVMGEYSSMEKSYKVMEMLRNAYIGIPLVMQNVDLTEEVINELKSMDKKGLQIVNTDTQPRVDFISNCYFQFPKDEEVEV